MKRRLALAALVVLPLAACSAEKRGTRDAPIDTAKQDNQAPYIVNMPDQYHNLALKCLGRDLVITHTRAGAPPVVIPNADLCSEAHAGNGIPRVAVTP